jgi:hypothetical protein
MTASRATVGAEPRDDLQLVVDELREMVRAYKELASRIATVAVAYHEDKRRDEAWRASIEAKLVLLLERQ